MLEGKVIRVNKISYHEKLEEVLLQLVNGAFLTVSDGNEKNTMTIGWGTIGYIWNRPIFEVLVRESRYTYKMLAKSDEFTVSVPLKGQLEDELSYCGSKSGSDVDKFSQLNLQTSPGKILSTPFISKCDIFYECEILYQSRMERSDLIQKIKKDCYPQSDYHKIFYGEIIAAYES